VIVKQMNLPTGKRNWVRCLSLVAGFGAIVASILLLLIARRESGHRGKSAAALALSGPVSWWPGESNANDVIGANHGTTRRGVSFAAGKQGTAFSFDCLHTGRNQNGTSFDAIRVPGFGMSLPGYEITIEFWQKAERAQVQSIICLSPYDITHVCRCIAPDPDGKVYFDFGNNHTYGQLSYMPPVSIFDSWQHFAFVASQTDNFMKIYRNGVLEAQKIGMTPFENINYDLLLGDCFTGLLDEVRIYDRALSATEILSIYNASSGKTGEVRWLKTPQLQAE